MKWAMEWLSMDRWSPYVVGIGIGILSCITFLLSDKPLGCSTGKPVAPKIHTHLRQGFGGSSAALRNPLKHNRSIAAMVASGVTHSSTAKAVEECVDTFWLIMTLFLMGVEKKKL